MVSMAKTFTFDNMLQAYDKVCRGKSEHLNVIRYDIHHLTRLNRLLKRIREEQYHHKRDIAFYVYEPKKRKVTSNDFEDKIVQEVLCTHVLGPLIASRIIYDNYASQDGKGTKLAIDRMAHFLRKYYIEHGSNEGYILQCDIRKYFDSIPIKKLHELIEKLPIDNKLKHLLVQEIRPENDSGIGICIGHQCSQWMAIYLLNRVDHIIKERLGIKYYGRYMDDFYLIHHDKDYLKYCLSVITEELEKLGLSLNQKTQIYKIKNGIKMLGFHTYLTSTGKIVRKLKSESKRRIKKRLTKYKLLVQVGNISIQDALDSYNAWRSYAIAGDTASLIKAIDARFYDMFSYELIKAGIDYSDFCYIPGRLSGRKNKKKRRNIKVTDIEWAKKTYSPPEMRRDEEGFIVLTKRK